MMSEDRLGLYLHIPFCRSKCVYCDFPSYPGMDNWQTPVIERMKEELRDKAFQLNHRKISTVYMGGGTPSTLAPDLLNDLMQTARNEFPFADDAEVSIEMNPGTVTDEFLDAAQQSGFNRISIGAQSANDRLLKLLGRIHSAEDIYKTVSKIRSHGFYNYNLDMMTGLPGQDLNDVTDTLQCFLSLKPTHISCYSLIVEEGTRMFDRVQSGEAVLPDEDLERAMYDTVRSTLEKAGYHQYEISNYALEGFECRHNLDCWNRKEYLGIGVAAAGFIGNRRTRNPASITDYCNKAEPEVIELSESDEMFESVMLGLRLTRGLSKNDFYERHHKDICQVYGAVIERLIGQGLLTWDDDYLRCTKRGLDLQNMVLTEFLQ